MLQKHSCAARVQTELLRLLLWSASRPMHAAGAPAMLHAGGSTDPMLNTCLISVVCTCHPAPQLAQAAGVPVVLDAGGSTDPICQELLRSVTVLSPNETELSNLTGGPADCCLAVALGACYAARSSRFRHPSMPARVLIDNSSGSAHCCVQACPPTLSSRLWRCGCKLVAANCSCSPADQISSHGCRHAHRHRGADCGGGAAAAGSGRGHGSGEAGLARQPACG